MIERYIDNTLLKPLTWKQVKAFVMDTYRLGFRGLVVDNFYLNYALKLKKHFPSTPTKLIQVLNFPMGNSSDCVFDVHPDVDEYDIVLPLYYMKNNNRVKLRDFVEVICAYIKEEKAIKFIVEENLWTRNELMKFVGIIYKVVKKRKIKNEIYIKSNTGFRGYSKLDKRLGDAGLIRIISANRFKVKIAGGVKTLYDTRKINSGGHIIGTSHGLEILEEEIKEKNERQ